MAEPPVTTHAASSPPPHSWSSRARRCRHHLATLTKVPPRGAVYGRSFRGLLKKLQDFPSAGGREGSDGRGSPTAAATSSRSTLCHRRSEAEVVLSTPASCRRLASEAHDPGELMRAVDHESGEARLLRLHALAGRAEDEAGHDHAVTVEDGRGDARGALGDLVHRYGQPGGPDLVEHAAESRPRHRRLRREGLEPGR